MDGEQDYTDSERGQYDHQEAEHKDIEHLRLMGFESLAEPTFRCCYNCKFWRLTKCGSDGLCTLFNVGTHAKDFCKRHKSNKPSN